MYCLHCGQGIASTETTCPACETEVRSPEFGIRQPRIWGWLARPLPFGLFLLALLSGLLFLGIKIYGRLVLPDPARTVEAFYDAISTHDKEKALQFVNPEKREWGLGFNIELIIQSNVTVEYENLRFKTVERKGNQARVRITGKARVGLEGRTREVLFNDEASLTALDRVWYLDYSSLGDLFVL